MSLDPLAADYPSWSSYNYVMGNPVKMIDPDGKDPTDGDPPGFWERVGNRVSGAVGYVTEGLAQGGAAIGGTLNAIGSNIAMGAPGTRQDPSSMGQYAGSFATGQKMGDIASVVGGTIVALGGGAAVVAETASVLGIAAVPATTAFAGLGATTAGTGAMNLIGGDDGVVYSKDGSETPTIKEQALDVKNNQNNGKNSVTVQTPDKKVHYDLDGATHKGVETPHKQYSYPNTNPATGQTYWNKDRKTVDPINQQDIRVVKKVLEKRNN